jgi:hypothetical protein
LSKKRKNIVTEAISPDTNAPLNSQDCRQPGEIPTADSDPEVNGRYLSDQTLLISMFECMREETPQPSSCGSSSVSWIWNWRALPHLQSSFEADYHEIRPASLPYLITLSKPLPHLSKPIEIAFRTEMPDNSLLMRETPLTTCLKSSNRCNWLCHGFQRDPQFDLPLNITERDSGFQKKNWTDRLDHRRISNTEILPRWELGKIDWEFFQFVFTSHLPSGYRIDFVVSCSSRS